MRPHIRPARQESAGRGGHGNGLPLLFLGGLNRAFLRSCCGAPVPVDSMRVRLLRKWQPVLHRALTERRTLLYSTIPLCRSADFLTVPASMENSTRRIQGSALLAALNA